MLILYKVDIIIISPDVTCYCHDIAKKIAPLPLKQQSLTDYACVYIYNHDYCISFLITYVDKSCTYISAI